MTPPVLIGLLVLAFLWGSAFPAIKIGLEGFSAGELALARYLVASLCFVPVLLITRNRLLPARRDIPRFLLIGFLGITIYHVALNYGEVHVTAGAASLIIATAPAITAILAYFLLGDSLPAAGWLGIAVSFAGVALIVFGEGKELGFNPYALLVLLSSLVTSLFFVLQKPLFDRYSAIEVTAFSAWAGTLPMLVFAPGLPSALTHAGAAPLWAAVYIGVFPAALAYMLMSYAISKAPVTLVTAFLYAVPVFSLLFSWLLIGEVPSWLTLVGGAVAIGGIILVNNAKKRQAHRERLRAASHMGSAG
ncbi:MAG TPA: DMT family transporter [Trueperaceae bacterium]